MNFDSHYPFRPPVVKFVTPVYHPNIDRGKYSGNKEKKNFPSICVAYFAFISEGKICLDVLQMPPSGSYNPAITLESILLSIQLLLASPNADDPLRNDVSDEYKYNRELFNQNAKKYSGIIKAVHKSDQSGTNELKSMEEDKQLTEITDGADADKTMPDAENGGGVKEAAPTTSKIGRKRKHDDS